MPDDYPDDRHRPDYPVSLDQGALMRVKIEIVIESDSERKGRAMVEEIERTLNDVWDDAVGDRYTNIDWSESDF